MPSTTTHDVTVLLIEDEAEIRRFLRTTLPHYGYRFYEATTGSDGPVQVSARNPDNILLDLGLPDMNDTRVIEKIRACSTLPIIALSARPGAGQGASVRSRRGRLRYETLRG